MKVNPYERPIHLEPYYKRTKNVTSNKEVLSQSCAPAVQLDLSEEAKAYIEKDSETNESLDEIVKQIEESLKLNQEWLKTEGEKLEAEKQQLALEELFLPKVKILTSIASQTEQSNEDNSLDSLTKELTFYLRVGHPEIEDKSTQTLDTETSLNKFSDTEILKRKPIIMSQSVKDLNDKVSEHLVEKRFDLDIKHTVDEYKDEIIKLHNFLAEYRAISMLKGKQVLDEDHKFLYPLVRNNGTQTDINT